MLNVSHFEYKQTSLESRMKSNLRRADQVLTIVNLILTSYTMLVNAICMQNLSVLFTGPRFELLMHVHECMSKPGMLHFEM